MSRYLLLLVFIGCAFLTKAQRLYSAANAHSHNDYLQQKPFWVAYGQHCGSIEADVFLRGDQLMVAHDSADIRSERTLAALYVRPIVEQCRANPSLCSGLQLLIDLKTAALPTLEVLVRELSGYPDVFGSTARVQVVVSGNMPPAEALDDYPAWLCFDGRFNLVYPEKVLERIPLFSTSFNAFSSWKGNGPVPMCDLERMKVFIATAHAKRKKVRFWGVPDVPEAWELLMKLEADWIGTDQPEALVQFLEKKKS
jgi:alkaline phosphatase